MRLLLLSNSTNYGTPYLEHCASAIDEFLGAEREVLLIPYAAVTVDYEQYEEMARNALSVFGIKVRSIHRETDAKSAVQNARALAVAGGNTFRLLQLLYFEDLIHVIREKIEEGMPYIGWSAGSNVAGISIRTTNDMPIVQPPSFISLGLVRAQINPHYTERIIPSHNGESRLQRLLEFVELNREDCVLGLPEGSWIRFENDSWKYKGSDKMVVVEYGKPVQYFNETEASKFLNARKFTVA